MGSNLHFFQPKKERYPSHQSRPSSTAAAVLGPKPEGSFCTQPNTSPLVNLRRSRAPNYQLGQKMWLSASDLPLWLESKKLSPKFSGPFEIQKIINPIAFRLKLYRSMCINPNFHVSKVKPVQESVLVPAALPLPPPQLIDGEPSTQFIACCVHIAEGEAFGTWWIGRDMVQKKVPGFQLTMSWTPDSP